MILLDYKMFHWNTTGILLSQNTGALIKSRTKWRTELVEALFFFYKLHVQERKTTSHKFVLLPELIIDTSCDGEITYYYY